MKYFAKLDNTNTVIDMINVNDAEAPNEEIHCIIILLGFNAQKMEV